MDRPVIAMIFKSSVEVKAKEIRIPGKCGGDK